MDEGFALRGRKEKGFGIGAEDDEPCEPSVGEVSKVFRLGFVIDFVGLGVEEGYCWRPGRKIRDRPLRWKIGTNHMPLAGTFGALRVPFIVVLVL